jgi:hypothetical protein
LKEREGAQKKDRRAENTDKKNFFRTPFLFVEKNDLFPKIRVLLTL